MTGVTAAAVAPRQF